MAFSQGIRFTISADTSKIRSEFGKVEQMAQATGQKVDAAMQAQNKAIQSLANSRRAADYAQANTLGKIRVVTKQLQEDAKSMAKVEQGSVQWLKQKERIEQNLVHLRGLQMKAQKEHVASMKQLGGIGQPSAGGGGSETKKGALDAMGEGMVKRIIWLGAGAMISGIVKSLHDYFQNQIKVAQAQDVASASSLASLRGRFAETGGLSGKLRQGQASMKDLESVRDFMKEREKFLSSGMQGVVSKFSSAELTKATIDVVELNARIQQQHDLNALIERDLNRQIALRKTILDNEMKMTKGSGRHLGSVTKGKEIGSLPETEAALAGGRLNSLTSSQIELRRLTKWRDYLKKKDARGTPMGSPEEIAEANIAVRNQAMDVAKARNNMALFGMNFAQGMSEQASMGRTFRSGRARPLSESERIARRAAMFRELANNLILTGATGTGARDAINAARASEAAVTDRLAMASSKVATPATSDATALKQEMVNTNEILKAIRESLAEKSIN